MLAKAEGAGNLAVLLGSATGRDGIGGASVLASAGFEEGSEAKRPSVQVGDPFEEKRLIEACLELLDRGLAVGVQDLGAAGLSCAASETAAKGGVGMDVDVARVAEREPGMNPVEVLTSESQERMLAIVDARDTSTRCCELATPLGGPRDRRRARHRPEPRFRVFDGLFDAIGVPGENPAPPSGGRRAGRERRTANRSPTSPSGASATVRCTAARSRARPPRTSGKPTIPRRDCAPSSARARTSAGELLALLATPTIADKTWVSRQYDHQLFLNTVAGPGADAAVLRVKGTEKALALSTDGKARFCQLDPRTGGRLVVLEAARNVASVRRPTARAR